MKFSLKAYCNILLHNVKWDDAIHKDDTQLILVL